MPSTRLFSYRISGLTPVQLINLLNQRGRSPNLIDHIETQEENKFSVVIRIMPDAVGQSADKLEALVMSSIATAD